MKALVTGATGFIGRRLIERLERPAVLARHPESARQLPGVGEVFRWAAPEAPPPEAFAGVDVVFHLAGEPVAASRWTAARKQRIYDSRVLGTRRLVESWAKAPGRPRVLVCASGVGYYGDCGDKLVDESSPPGADWIARLSRDWETEANRAAELGVRVVTARNGMVLGKGGALAKMLPAFRAGLGGRLGSGRQWVSWIHIDDVVGLLLHAAARADIRGPMNAVTPHPVTNREFTRELASALRRPAILPVPEFALRLAFGEMAAILLASARAVPRVAQETGYRFRFPELPEALRDVLRKQ